MEATTVTPVVEPDVTLTMTMQEARNLREVFAYIVGPELRVLLPGRSQDEITELDTTVDDVYKTLGAVTRENA